jgi:GNAT superfamily N-acetyltransferase
MSDYLKNITTEKTLCHSKAFAFVLREFSDLVARGHAELELPFTNQSQVSYGTDAHGNIIAASVHAYDPAKRVCWIQFSAVDGAHRRRGAYRALFAHVAQLARRAGAVKIYSGIATANESMHQVAAQLTRRPVTVRYKYDLTDQVPNQESPAK